VLRQERRTSPLSHNQPSKNIEQFDGSVVVHSLLCHQSQRVRVIPLAEKGSSPDRSIIRQILRHLIEHPEAKDTRRGIVRWWVPDVGVERREEEVQQAIDWLVTQNWLVKRDTASSQTLYGMNRTKLEAIEEFLKTL
jgi:hypothetical protein